jgi:acetyl-CoA carboxylase carboxyltransferase component
MCRVQANYEHMSKQVDALRALVNKVAAGGPDALKARHLERGKLMARQVRMRWRSDRPLLTCTT